MEAIQLIQLTPQQLQNIVSEGVKVQLEDLKKHFQPIQPKEYLTRQNVAEMFSVNLSTLHNWNRTGKLKPLGISGRVYYLRSQVEEALIPLNQ